MGRAVNQGVVIEFLGIFAFNYAHPNAARHASGNQRGRGLGKTWLSVPQDWIASFGDITKFCARVVANVFNGRVFGFFGEALRQAGILILGSALVIWGLAFILGLQCGIEGAYFNRSSGGRRPTPACSPPGGGPARDHALLGYMMSAKVGTGLVAEIGAVRISDEIDALEVMGVNSLVSSAPPGCWPPGWCCPSCTSRPWGPASSPATSRWSSRSARSRPAASS